MKIVNSMPIMLLIYRTTKYQLKESFRALLFPLGLILRSLLRLGLRWSGERKRLACCPRRPAESGSDGSGETPKPTRGTRVLPGPLTLISAMPRGLPP